MRAAWRRVAIVLAFLLLMAIFTAVYPLRQWRAGQATLAQARQDLTSKEKERADLEQRIAVLNTPGEVERLARERFGLARPGEVAYVVLGDDPPPVTDTALPR